MQMIDSIARQDCGPLADGKLDGDLRRVPVARLCIQPQERKVVHGPATHNQPRYDVRVRDGQIEVKLAG